MPGHTIYPLLRGPPGTHCPVKGWVMPCPLWDLLLPAPGFPDGITHQTVTLQWPQLPQENPVPSEGNIGAVTIRSCLSGIFSYLILLLIPHTIVQSYSMPKIHGTCARPCLRAFAQAVLPAWHVFSLFSSKLQGSRLKCHLLCEAIP